LQKPRLKLVINCGPCEEYIGACLASVRAQTYGNWQACVTIDPSGDYTYDAALTASSGDVRIEVQQNRTRLYAMQNLILGTQRSQAAPDDVIVVLDGDDWLASTQALEVIASAYERDDCWATYGSWISNDPSHTGLPRGRWPAYAPDTTNFRQAQWLGTAVRTWKKWLWDLIDDRDFRDSKGAYFRVTEDQASMLPILEMSGTPRARHIPDVLMIYNRTTPHACGKLHYKEMLANADYLRGRRPYSRLYQRSPGGQINLPPTRVSPSR
jgi:glycosyltransferase involved in cell wall biosynthesis